MSVSRAHALAVGLSMLFGTCTATGALAEIVSLNFSPQVVTPESDDPSLVTMSHDGGLETLQLDFYHIYYVESNPYYSFDVYEDWVNVAGDIRKLKKLNFGDTVSAEAVTDTTDGTDYWSATTVYYGFRSSADLYGWVKIAYMGSAPQRKVAPLEGAIQTTAVTAITVGDLPAGVDPQLTPMPVPPMLPAMGLVVLGLGGLGLWQPGKRAA